MRSIWLALLLSAPAFSQVPDVPPIGAFCLPTVATTHTIVNPSTGNTIVTMYCDTVSGLYHYGVAGAATNWQQAQCLTTIEPFAPTATWLQHAWAACVTTTVGPSDQAYINRLFAMWIPRPTILGTPPVLTLKSDGTLGPQLVVGGVAQTMPSIAVGGLRLASGTVSPRYCNVSGFSSVQGQVLPANTYALCTLISPPQGGFPFTPSTDGVSIQAPTEAYLVDAAGHVWGIDSKGVITIDGIEDSTTANVISVIYIGGLMWQHANNLWWSKSSPTAPWLPAGGTPTPPTVAVTTGGTSQKLSTRPK